MKRKLSSAAAVARRVPWSMRSHLNLGSVHLLEHANDALGLWVVTETRYRHGQVRGPGVGCFWVVGEQPPRRWRRLANLLRFRPKILRRALQLYPEKGGAA